MQRLVSGMPALTRISQPKNEKLKQALKVNESALPEKQSTLDTLSLGNRGDLSLQPQKDFGESGVCTPDILNRRPKSGLNSFWISKILDSRISFPRHTEFPLPKYRFLPGVNPHPLRDKKGHSFQKIKNHSTRKEAFLFGVDLWNHVYWWECHEAFEELWKKLPLESPERLLLQGWIQFAAALIQWTLGKDRGAKSLFEMAYSKWEALSRKHKKIKGVSLKNSLELLSTHFLRITSGKKPGNPLKDYPQFLLEKRKEGKT